MFLPYISVAGHVSRVTSFSFQRPLEATYEIWLQLAQWFQKKSRLELCTDGRTLPILKAPPGAFGSGELKVELALMYENVVIIP